MRQLVPAASVVPQVVAAVAAKSLGFVPVMLMAIPVSVALPVLDNVTGWDALVVSRFWLPNGSVLGDSPAEGAVVAVGSFDTKTVTFPELHPPQVL